LAEFVNSVRPLLELLYFAAGILLALGLGFAYGQLRVLKQDLRTRNVRSAREKALEACDRYFEKYVSLANTYFEDRKGLPIYEGPIGDFSKNTLSGQWMPHAVSRFKVFSWISALNQLESIAAYFCTEVADERSAYPIIGRSFVKTVELHYDLIALSRPSPASPYYASTVKLYEIWKARLQYDELDHQRALVSRDIDALPTDKPIRPLGDDS